MIRKIVIHFESEPGLPKLFWWQLEEWENKKRSGILFCSDEFRSEKECRDNIDLMKSIPKSASVEIYDGK